MENNNTTESELIILNTILLDNNLIHQASKMLEDRHFIDPINRYVFQQFKEIIVNQGKAVDITILKDACTIKKIKPVYWLNLIDATPTTDAGFFNEHINLLKSYSTKLFLESFAKDLSKSQDVNTSNFHKWLQAKESQFSGIIEAYRKQPVSDDGPQITRDEAAPFPMNALPVVIKSLVEQGAKSSCCPVDFIAIPALTSLGAAIGNSLFLQIKNGWKSKANINTAVIGVTGTGKTPAQDIATRPIKDLQYILANEYKAKMVEYENKLSAWELQCNLARKNNEPKPAKPEEPFMTEIYTSDTTTEALGQCLERNPKGMVIILDELTSWIHSLNQYRGGKGADKESYLSFWSGVDTKINRKNKPPAILHKPFVSVTGGMPPSVLSSLVDERSQGEDGFIHRILFSYPDPVKNSGWSEDSISSEVLNEYSELFKKLWNLPNEFKVITLDSEAYTLWVKLFNNNVEEMTAIDFPDSLRGPWAKMPAQLARITLIIHTVRYFSGETKNENVDKESLAMAALIINYFKSHARRIYSQLSESKEDELVRKTIEWAKKHNIESISARDIQIARICKSKEEVNFLFQTLEKAGYGKIDQNINKNKTISKVFKIITKGNC